MQFRNTRTGALTTASLDTKLFRILSRSGRWEAVGDAPSSSSDPLEALTVKELRSMADANGVEIPKKVRKARLVEIVRDAGISATAAPVEDEFGKEDEAES